MTDGIKVGSIKMNPNIVDRMTELRAKYEETVSLINQVFLHEQYYKDLPLAAFASCSKIALEGFRGCGKSFFMDSMLRLINPKIRWRVQSYLDADIEDTIVRPDIPSLMRGEEKLHWKPAVNARVKAFDEIQRLGVKALSVMFGMMDTGKAYYLEQSEGIYPFWAIFTMNPTETAEDNLNFAIPEPLYDRFDCMMWMPRCKMEYESQIKTQREMREIQEKLEPIWEDKDLLDMWDEVAKIPIPDEIHGLINLSCRILSFCLFAQSYDATSLPIAKKRALCSQCNANYFCHKVARPPSIRAKQSWMQLSRGFAYRRGHSKVEMSDLRDSFPAVFWRRVQLMDEDYTEKPEKADRLKLFTQLWEDLLREIGESKDYFRSLDELKTAYDENAYSRLSKFADSKAWFKEQVDWLDRYYDNVRVKLIEKMDEAKKNKNKELATLVWIRSSGLPTEKSPFDALPFDIKMNISPEFLSELAGASPELFDSLKDSSGKVKTLNGKVLESLTKLEYKGKIKLSGEAIWN